MTTVPIVPTTNGDDNMMWMWLSSFPPTVTEDDIRAMVRECISFDAEETIDVKMLVKKDADISKLRAVSFKIGIDVKHEDAAMDEDICTMVKECLSVENDDPVVVKMLVKKGADIAKLSSVTFKVGVSRDYRDSSLDADNWPEGLAFREFIDMDKRPTVTSSGFSKRRTE
ncbi:hypothetical protein pipiens_016286 [Culex pipiens pipiens]|uniref:Uncharacterized protein n=1 Tax=Culex pipiens pipiens TaxID=38569 RepID=A0ABD1CNA1_CULPP